MTRSSGGDQANVFGDRGVCGASPLAIDDFVEIVGYANIGRLHQFLHDGCGSLREPVYSRGGWVRSQVDEDPCTRDNGMATPACNPNVRTITSRAGFGRGAVVIRLAAPHNDGRTAFGRR